MPSRFIAQAWRNIASPSSPSRCSEKRSAVLCATAFRHPAAGAPPFGKLPGATALPVEELPISARRHTERSDGDLDASPFANPTLGCEEPPLACMADLAVADEHFNLVLPARSLFNLKRHRPESIIGRSSLRRRVRPGPSEQCNRDNPRN